MDIENYQSNSYRSKKEATEIQQTEEKKKVEKVVVGSVKTKKKSGLGKLFGNFVSEDAQDIKSYLFRDIVVPTIKKTISDTVDMILYGGSSKSRTSASRVSYRSYYDEPRTRSVRDVRPTVGYSYDDVIVESRGDGEEVLSRMNELIDTYQIVSVADLYDLVGLTGNYTDNKYGWTNLSTAEVVRVREGYKLDLPRPMPIK